MSTATTEKQNTVTDRRSAGGSISSEVMVASIVFFFVVAVFVIFLHVYVKSRWRRMASTSRRYPVINSAANAGPRRGLDLSVIASLPVSVFRSQDFKAPGGLECSVCLSELVDGEKVRILPKCNHGFHLDCIDMWFYSHSTCPLCRSEPLPFPEVDYTTADFTAANSSAAPANAETPPEDAGTQVPAASGASSSEGALVIEIPRRPAAAPGFSSEDAKSPVPSTPTLNRLRSLRRILSREKKVPVPCCGASGDIEQGTIESEGVTAAGLSLR